MNPGIYDDNLVAHVHIHDGTVPVTEMRLISTQAGPAGHATVKLSEAIDIEFDFAQLSVLTGLTVTATGNTQAGPLLAPADIELLKELLGIDRAQQAMRALANASDAPVRIMASSERLRNTSVPLRGTLEGQRLGRAGALVDMAQDDRETMLVRAVAAMEAAATAGGMKSPRVTAALTAEASSALIDLDEEDARTSDDLVSLRDDVLELVDRDPEIAFMVRDVIDEARPLLTGRAAGVASFVREVLTDGGQMRDDDSLDIVVNTWRRTHERELVMNSLAFSMSRDESMELNESWRSGRWHMTWHEHPGGSWVRILDPDDQMLVGLVPVRANKRVWEAEAIVPTTRPVHQWIIEVTDTPLPAAGMKSVELIIEAIQLGRIATTRSALTGRRGQVSADAWLACAEAWKAAGDTVREARARTYVDQPRVDRPVFLADRVRTVLGFDMP